MMVKRTVGCQLMPDFIFTRMFYDFKIVEAFVLADSHYPHSTLKCGSSNSCPHHDSPFSSSPTNVLRSKDAGVSLWSPESYVWGLAFSSDHNS